MNGRIKEEKDKRRKGKIKIIGIRMEMKRRRRGRFQVPNKSNGGMTSKRKGNRAVWGR